MSQKATIRIDQELFDQLKKRGFNPRIWIEERIKEMDSATPAVTATAAHAPSLNIEDLLTPEFITQLLEKITELKNDFNNDVLNFFSMIRKEMSLEGAVRSYLPKQLPEALETFYELHDPHENWFCTYNNFVKHIKKVRPNVSIEDAPEENEDEESLDNKF